MTKEAEGGFAQIFSFNNHTLQLLEGLEHIYDPHGTLEEIIPLTLM